MELYIHIPFCMKKCSYCDFLSFSNCYELVPDYVSALLDDIGEEGEKCREALTSIYIGGGTPSSIEARFIEDIMSKVKECYTIADNAEITIEINPGTLTPDKAKTYISCGINRASIGAQSFDDGELKLLGRIHNSGQIREAVSILRQAGFKNVSLDLISALPGQGLDDFINNLNEAIKLEPEHISAYELIIEEGTPFYETYGPESDYVADDDTEADIYLETVKALCGAGYRQYEISNFAREGFESRHNLGYWTGEKYIGCGLGAVGYDGCKRYKKSTDLKQYINCQAPAFVEDLSKEDKISEYLFLGLRTSKGINTGEFKEIFGLDMPDEYIKTLEKLDAKYINRSVNTSDKSVTYSFTPEGFLISNSVLSQFV